MTPAGEPEHRNTRLDVTRHPYLAFMASQRQYGEGSVYRQANGLWCGVIEMPAQDGQRRRRYLRAKTKRQLVERMTEARSEVQRGMPSPDRRLTTEAFLRWWATDVAPQSLKESTVVHYEWIVGRYLVPALGNVPLARLGPEHVHAMLAAMADRGLSARTQRQARAVLRRALGHAEKWGHVTRNAAALVDAPRIGRARTDDALTADEARSVLDAASGDRLEALAWVVLTLGLRKGEALALRWVDIDFTDGTVRVGATLKRRAGGGCYLDTPKTEGGYRVLPLSEALSQVLRGHMARQEAVGEGGFVFTTPIGTPLDPRNSLRWWHNLTERAGVGRRRFHASRHTAASLMHEAGVPLEVISRVLGHASIAITADTYTEIRDAARRRGVEAVASLLTSRT